MSPLERIEKALAEIEVREKAATPQPWVFGHLGQLGIPDITRPKDGEFVAHARTDIPKLLAALRDVLTWDFPEHPKHTHILEFQNRLADKLEGK